MAIDIRAIAHEYNWSEVYQLADNYRQQQQWQQAAIAYHRAIELRPDFFWSHHHLGDALIKLQQWQRAVKAYGRAVELDPNFFWSWNNLGDALTKLERWDMAIAVYLQGVQLEPERQLTYQKLGTAFKQRGNLENSIKRYRQLIQTPNQNHIFNRLQSQPEILVQIAQTLVNTHQLGAAIVLYYMVLQIQPEQTQILAQLSQLLQQHNKLQETINARNSSLKSDFLTRQEVQLAPQANPNFIPGEITIRINVPVSPDRLENLGSMVGWSSRPLERVQHCLEHSFCHVSAWHSNGKEKQLIGFARAVSDGVFHATLLDIIIHPHFQNRGLGKQVVQTLIEQLQQFNVHDITLFASPHVVDFYHKLGFVSNPNNLQWMLWSSSHK